MTQESRGRDTPATRRNVNAARRSAAASMCKSAESQDRIAQMYEERTEHGLSHDDDLDHTACHRQFAQYDRRMAKRVRQSADKQLARRTWGEQGDGVSLSVRPRWLGPNGTPERSARTVTQVIERFLIVSSRAMWTSPVLLSWETRCNSAKDRIASMLKRAIRIPWPVR